MYNYLYLIARHKHSNGYSAMIRAYREIANTWYYLANSINLLLENRKGVEEKTDAKSKSDLRTLNLLLILNTAALIEGSITSVLIQHISRGEYYKRANSEKDIELRRILDNLIDSVSKSQWRDLWRNVMMLTDIDLKQIFDGNWEIIESHFKFRNLIAHGGIIITGIDFLSDANNVKEIRNEERIDMHNYDSLFNFLVKYSFIDKHNKNKLIDWEFLKTEISDFFIENSIVLIKKFYDAYGEMYPHNKFIQGNLKVINKISSC